MPVQFKLHMKYPTSLFYEYDPRKYSANIWTLMRDTRLHATKQAQRGSFFCCFVWSVLRMVVHNILRFFLPHICATPDALWRTATVLPFPDHVRITDLVIQCRSWYHVTSSAGLLVRLLLHLELLLHSSNNSGNRSTAGRDIVRYTVRDIGAQKYIWIHKKVSQKR